MLGMISIVTYACSKSIAVDCRDIVSVIINEWTAMISCVQGTAAVQVGMAAKQPGST